MYGGQAVIEGVMMRGAHAVAIAMRAPSQDIVIHTEKLPSVYHSRLVRVPFLRGLVALWDALGLGMRALTLSANTQTGEDEKLEGPQLYLTLAASLAIAIGLFFLLPAAVGQVVHWVWPITPEQSSASASVWTVLASNLLEGLVRLALLIIYLLMIGKMPEIQRVFAYHGAEHKTINAYEAGADLTPVNVQQYSIEHPRCGTAFLLTLLIFSVLLFALLGKLSWPLLLLSRIIFLPLLAGVAYEYIRWTANHLGSPLVQWLVKPNLSLQHLTTREPTLEMLEVSIAAFQAMRKEEESRSALPV
jgi:uncharacterized protein YqhQ